MEEEDLGGGGGGCLQPGSFPRNEVAAEPQEVVPSSLTATSESGDMSWPQLLKVLEFDPKVMVEPLASCVLPHWAVSWKLEAVNRKSRGNLQCSRHCLGRPEYKGVLI